jgi:hypothetical protein
MVLFARRPYKNSARAHVAFKFKRVGATGRSRKVGLIRRGMKTCAPSAARRKGWLVAVASRLLVYAAIVVIAYIGYDGFHYLRGDCLYYFLTARSLLRDGDLDLSNQLDGGLAEHETEVSIGIDGRIVPKHPILMPVAALPFIAVMGESGALVFNFLQVALLLFVVYRLALRVAVPGAAAAAVLLTGLGTMLPYYVWNFSPDIFAGLLLATGLLAMPANRNVPNAPAGPRYVLAGVLLGFACVAKFALVLFVPGLVLLCRSPRWRNFGALLAGAAVPVAGLLVFNTHLFGSPFVTSYDRIAILRQGRWIPYSHRNDFTLPLRVGVSLLLFDRVHGLLRSSPLTLPSFLALAFLARRRAALVLYLASSSVALFLFYARYRFWYTSHYGNRFLIPAVVLLAIPLAAVLDGIWRAYSVRRCASQ